jgi:hypothetical protein
VGIAIVSALVLITLALIAKYDSAGGDNPPGTLGINNIVKDQLVKDSDSDTLKDWEESFYKTDPNDPDTDDDGVLDGAEITAGMDPTVSGPGTTTPTTNTKIDITPLTATDRLSIDVFKLYLEAKKSVGTIDQDTSDKIAETILNQDYSESGTIYTADALSLIAKPSTAMIREYANAFGQILSLPASAGDTEMVIFEKLQGESLEIYRENLETRRDRYRSMIKRVLTLSVPTKNASAHIKIVNGLEILAESIDASLAMETDPIGALIRIARYEDGIGLIQAGMIETYSFLKSSGVSFSGNEAGSLFTL